MTRERMQSLMEIYRDGLLNDTIPFWVPAAIDTEHGGYLTALDQDGTVLHTDKPVWFQGRFAWLLATMYSTVERKPEWLAYAKHGLDFMDAHCFDTDGRMFFSVTREGKPLRKRRYLFSESFAVISQAAYGVAANDDGAKRRAREIFDLMLHYYNTPGSTEPKTDPETRPMKGLAMPMILIATAQELRKAGDEAFCNEVIDNAINEIERDFMKPEFRCVLETVGPNGEFYDNFDGRLVTPGHSIEAGWFILEEARRRGNDERLIRIGSTIVDWSFEMGWDDQYGGMLYFRDAKGLPPTEYWHDMKFWWPHNEAIIATLLAHLMTGDEKYARWHGMVHDWACTHFPDGLHGEWFGYLHRDGSLSTRVKGTMWKGPFHLPRMQWYCWKLLEETLAASA